MLCSECRRRIKPVVAIDIDGTLADYHQHFSHFAQQYFMDDNIKNRYTGKGKFHEGLGMSLEDYRECKLAYRQGGGKRSIPIMSGAKTLLRVAREMDCEVWITTTRPFLRLDSTDPDTRFWLDRHDIDFDYLLYDDDKYEVLAESVDPKRVVMVLDDLLEQCQAAERFFPGAALMIQRLHNHDARFDRSVNSLHLASRVVIDRVMEWREING